MAEQRAFGNTDKSPAEGGTQVRERTQEAGTQGHDRHQDSGAQNRDRNQESGAQGHDRTQEAGTQGRDRNQEGARHGEETASSQQSREQMAAVENSLEDAIRAKPLQSVLMAAGLGMLMAFLFRK